MMRQVALSADVSLTQCQAQVLRLASLCPLLSALDIANRLELDPQWTACILQADMSQAMLRAARTRRPELAPGDGV